MIEKAISKIEIKINDTLKMLEEPQPSSGYEDALVRLALISRYEALIEVKQMLNKIKEEEIGL